MELKLLKVSYELSISFEWNLSYLRFLMNYQEVLNGT